MPRHDFTKDERRKIDARINPTVFAAWRFIAAMAFILVASYALIGRPMWLMFK